MSEETQTKVPTKLVKVTMEYSDGDIHTLETVAAEAWIKDVNDQIFMSYIHGCKMQKHPWVITKKDVCN